MRAIIYNPSSGGIIQLIAASAAIVVATANALSAAWLEAPDAADSVDVTHRVDMDTGELVAIDG